MPTVTTKDAPLLSNTVTTTTTTNGPGEAASATSPTKEQKKKKKGLLGGIKSPFKFIGGGGGGGGGGKTYCRGCKKKCSGEVLRVNDAYFHPQCFHCKGCGESLSQGGFFTRDSDHYCARCYQSNYGTKCHGCGQYVEGEVVSALGKTYHQKCFRCAGCQRPFPTGERVTFTGKTCLCQQCVKDEGGKQHHKKQQQQQSPQTVKNGGATTTTAASADDLCAGCNEPLRDGQALMALNKQYHLWCFKCKACALLLHGEYMGKDGHPYCEKDYQQLFGVKCSYCLRFISGKVLQAGDNSHFHPTCARCTKCGDPFGDGEEMFLQGAAIWHPRCGPGPSGSSGGGGGGMVINGFNDHNNADSVSMASTTAGGGGAQYSRASSPGASLMHHRSRGGDGYNNTYYDSGRFSRSTTNMSAAMPAGFGGGLYSSSSTYSLRRPLEPGDRIDSLANVNHFHLPSSRRGSCAATAAGGIGGGTPRHSSALPPAQAQAQAIFMAQQQEMMLQQQRSCRPISCPPKPGYTHARLHDDLISQQSFDSLRPSSTFSHGFGSRSQTPAAPFVGEHKIYPLHVLFTSNYKLPPDVDRCSLEMHLTDEEFAIALGMGRGQFYAMPLWKRNDLKKRVRLF